MTFAAPHRPSNGSSEARAVLPVSTAPGAPPAWQVTGYRHIWMPYAQMQTAAFPLAVERTEGVYLHLADGRRLLDGLASWWSACHGYGHPHITQAVHRQLDRMPHVMFGGINHEPALRLATRLAELLPGTLNRVFFSDSGSVAVEVAMKMAVQYWLNQGAGQRRKFISFHHAYHGDTTGAMSLADPTDGMHMQFRGFLLEQYPHPLPHSDSEFAGFEQFVQRHATTCAAVILEPLVQAAGGMKFHASTTLHRIAEICHRHGLLFIADEIATGFGRTGSMFACEQAGVIPDIICLSKALTGGTLGLAATVATDEIFAAFLGESQDRALMHGPTYMANPLACAAASASLELFQQEPRLAQVQRIEQEFARELASCRALPGVVDVRVRGAIGVVQLQELHDVAWLRQQFVDRGVWLRPIADVIYSMPALTISPAELQTLCAAIRDVTEQWSKRFCESAGRPVT